MRILIYLLICIFCTTYLCSPNIVFGQTSFPKGVYTSLHDIQWKTPSMKTEATAELRYESSVFVFGGNDYNMYSKGVLKREIRKEWLAYSDGTELYLNCFPMGLQSQYSKVLVEGDYMFFRAGVNENAVKAVVIPSVFIFGITGWLLSAVLKDGNRISPDAIPVALASAAVGGIFGNWIFGGRRRSYVLDLSTGMTHKLNPKFMMYLLADDLDLQTDYENEKDQKRLGVIKEYIDKLNDRIEQRKSYEKINLGIDIRSI